MMAVLFGVLGLFIAVPLLAAVYVGVRYFYVRGEVPPVRNNPAAHIILPSSMPPAP
jgi:predicted PurR-regulated permease PerM